MEAVQSLYMECTQTMFSIGIGSKTSTGGVVIEGNDDLLFDGLVASSVGHKATCPACKKGIGEIVAVGDRSVYLPAGPAARAGDYIACGCPPGSNTLVPRGTISIGSKHAGAGMPVYKLPNNKTANPLLRASSLHGGPRMRVETVSYLPNSQNDINWYDAEREASCASAKNDVGHSSNVVRNERIVLKSEDSLSGFEIDQEGAHEIYNKLGLNNIPHVSIIDSTGLHLADEMLASALPADKLIGLLEPSPIQRLKALPVIKRLVTNTGTQTIETYWHDKIDEISIGMGARSGIKYNHELMNRYRDLPR